MGDHKEGRVLRTLGQGEELLGQLKSFLLVRPHAVKVAAPPQGGKELRDLSDLLAELSHAAVCLLYFGGGKSPGDHQRWAESSLEYQFLLEAFGRFLKLLEQ